MVERLHDGVNPAPWDLAQLLGALRLSQPISCAKLRIGLSTPSASGTGGGRTAAAGGPAQSGDGAGVPHASLVRPRCLCPLNKDFHILTAVPPEGTETWHGGHISDGRQHRQLLGIFVFALWEPFGIASIKRLRAILAADRQRHIRTALVGAKDG